MSKIYAPKLCGIVKLLRHIIYNRNKAVVKISVLIKIYAPKLCVHQKNRRPNSPSAYYLGSAESPTADFFQVWLKSSRSGDVASRSCSPQVTWRLRPPSLYRRRLSRTVPAVVPARLVKISALCPNICGRLYLHYFLGKSQKSISAHKCPITAPKIRTWSQKLSKFSCNTFDPLVLAFGRGRWKWLKSCMGSAWVGEGLDKHHSLCAGL
jgi:hypothetical protein